MSYPDHSLEATVLRAVIEDRKGDAAKSLVAHFLDGELVEFYDHAETLLDMIHAEAVRRGLPGR